MDFVKRHPHRRHQVSQVGHLFWKFIDVNADLRRNAVLHMSGLDPRHELRPRGHVVGKCDVCGKLVQKLQLVGVQTVPDEFSFLGIRRHSSDETMRL